MDDGLVAVLTEITYAKLNWEEIAKRMGGKKHDPDQFGGVAAKHGLRIILTDLIKKSGGWAKQLELPRLSYGAAYDEGSHVLIAGENQRHITTVDAFLSVNNRPVALDIRTSPWRVLTHKNYFKKPDVARSVVLDDLFGPGNYDRVLVVPDSVVKEYRGVHIARPSFSLIEYQRQADEAAKKHDLLIKNQARDST